MREFVIFACLSILSFAASADEIEDRILKGQIGQMLVVGFRGTAIDENAYISKAIKDLNLGGVILFDIDVPTKRFPRNIVNPAQVKKLTADLKACSSTPMLIAIDAEGGLVNRLKPEYGFLDIPSHQKLGAKQDTKDTRNSSLALARELSELGFNTNFAPVVDVNVNPLNPVIGKLGRSFSRNPLAVAAHAGAFIEGQHESGILTAVKHFPGHGSSSGDTHQGLVDITASYDDTELVPYEQLIRNGLVDMVMTSHIMNLNYDATYPVTLSEHYIQPILREKFGFDGVVVSDDMNMGAITNHYRFEESLIRAVNAGCDLLIISNNGSSYDENAPYDAAGILFNAVRDNKIAIGRIHEAAQRIEKLKTRLTAEEANR